MKGPSSLLWRERYDRHTPKTADLLVKATTLFEGVMEALCEHLGVPTEDYSQFWQFSFDSDGQQPLLATQTPEELNMTNGDVIFIVPRIINLQEMLDGDSETEHIHVKVQGGRIDALVHYRMNRNTPLKKLMVDYCGRLGLQFHAQVHLFLACHAHIP